MAKKFRPLKKWHVKFHALKIWPKIFRPLNFFTHFQKCTGQKFAKIRKKIYWPKLLSLSQKFQKASIGQNFNNFGQKFIFSNFKQKSSIFSDFFFRNNIAPAVFKSYVGLLKILQMTA